MRGDEIALNGLRPVALDIRIGDPTPFRLPESGANPVQITLEGEFPEQLIGSGASLLGPHGAFFETTGPVIRKYGSELVAGSDGSPYAIGNTLSGDFPSTPGAAQPRFSGVFLYPRPRVTLQRGDLTITCLDGGTGRIIFSTYLGGAFEESGRFRGIDRLETTEASVPGGYRTVRQSAAALGIGSISQVDVSSGLAMVCGRDSVCRTESLYGRDATGTRPMNLDLSRPSRLRVAVEGTFPVLNMAITVYWSNGAKHSTVGKNVGAAGQVDFPFTEFLGGAHGAPDWADIDHIALVFQYSNGMAPKVRSFSAE